MVETSTYRQIDGADIARKETTFSRKLTRRMRSSYDQSKLRIVGGGHNGQIVSSFHMMPIFEHAIYSPSGDPLVDASFNKLLPVVNDVLLGNHNDQQGYIAGFGGDDLNNQPQVAINTLSQRVDSSQTVFRIIMGATNEMPLRVLSYPLPVLQMMDVMQKYDIVPPKLQIVFANNISSQLNNMDYTHVKNQTTMFAEAERLYIEEFFPRIAGDVVFLEDTPIDEGSEASNLLNYATTALHDQGEEALKDMLLKKGMNPSLHGSLTYGAAHILFHDLKLDGLLQPLLPEGPEFVQPEAVINVGGFQEQDFYHIRSFIKQRIKMPLEYMQTMQLFTRHYVPPYYMARGGDLSLEDVLQGFRNEEPIAKTAKKDLDYLSDTTNARGSFDEFVTHMRERINR